MATLETVLCVICSCGAGLGAAFFGCILSWADHEKRKNGGAHTRRSHFVAILGVIGSTVFGFSSLVGLYFGPVTLVVVIRAGSLLPANAFFSQVFGLRPLTRDDFIGTIVTISGVLCFSIFGGSPAESPKEDVYLELIRWTGAIVCNFALLLVFVGSLSALVLASDSSDQLMTTLAVTNVGGVSSAFMDLAAKGWSAALSRGVDEAWYSMLFWMALGLNVIFLVSMRVSMIYGCKRCDVLLFVPLNTVLNIFYSVLAGMVVLQEYKQVTSWPGLLGASTSVLGGVVMLVSGPAARPDEKDDDEKAQASSDIWSSDREEESDMEVLVGGHDHDRRPTTSVRYSPSSASSPHRHLDLENTPHVKQSLRGNFRTSPDGSPPTQRRRPHSSSDSERGELSDHVEQEKTVFETFAHGLRPEIVRMNSVHREAAKAKRQWRRVRRRLRTLVFEGSDDEATPQRAVTVPAARSAGLTHTLPIASDKEDTEDTSSSTE